MHQSQNLESLEKQKIANCSIRESENQGLEVWRTLIDAFQEKMSPQDVNLSLISHNTNSLDVETVVVSNSREVQADANQVANVVARQDAEVDVTQDAFVERFTKIRMLI